MKSVARHSGLVVSLEHTAELKCLMKCGVKVSQWTFTAYGQSSVPSVFYSGERGLDKIIAVRANVSVEANGDLVLSIDNIQLEDAGMYTCKTLCPGPNQKNDLLEEVTELVVLYGQPGCLSNLSKTVNEGERIQIECDVFYRGNWAPVITWSQNGQDIPALEGGIQTNRTPDGNAKSVLTIFTSYNTNKAIYSCSTQFTHYVGEVNSTFTVLPSYSHTCTWPPLNVKYKPRDLKIFPQRSSLFVGEELTCSADANPGAEYEWKDLGTGNVVGRATFKLEESMTNQEKTYLACKATNEISYATLPVNVTVTVNRTLSAVQMQIILAIVPSSVLLLTLVIAVYFIHSRRARTNSGRKDRVENPGPIASPSIMNDNEASDSASYASIPSAEVGKEHAAEDAINTVESSSIHPKQNTDRYSQLEAREIPLPAVYSRLGKNKLPIPDASIKPRENDYVNVNNQQQSEGYYNIGKFLAS